MNLQLIPVVCILIIGCHAFIPFDMRHIVQMLSGLSTGIAYTANLILIRRYVHTKMRNNAVALSCAFRLIGEVSVHVLRVYGDTDEVYSAVILISLTLLSAVLIICCDMKIGKDRVWDEYYESYFQRQAVKLAENEESLLNRLTYFFLVLGIRLPGLLINNNVTKSIQLRFLANFSSVMAQYHWILILACIVLLLMTAFNLSARNPVSLKIFLIPAGYLIFIMLLVNIPIIYINLEERGGGGFSLVAIILINTLLDVVFFGGVLYLLDTALIQSNLGNLKISLVISLEILLVSAMELLISRSNILNKISIPGFYAILTICSLIPIVVYHKGLKK